LGLDVRLDGLIADHLSGIAPDLECFAKLNILRSIMGLEGLCCGWNASAAINNEWVSHLIMGTDELRMSQMGQKRT
jgi:hypothetical protein